MKDVLLYYPISENEKKIKTFSCREDFRFNSIGVHKAHFESDLQHLRELRRESLCWRKFMAE